MNRYRGETRLKIDAKNYTVCFDWNAIATLRSEFGADYFDALAKAADQTDVQFLAKVVEIGLRKHHDGALTAEQIVEASPPIVATIEVINKALTAASWGPDGPPAEDGEENPPDGHPTLLRRLFALPLRRA